jgi:hypothetical protein
MSIPRGLAIDVRAWHSRARSWPPFSFSGQWSWTPGPPRPQPPRLHILSWRRTAGRTSSRSLSMGIAKRRQRLRRNHPECRAAFPMVTGHQQPDPRVGRPGRESNPVQSRSQWDAAIQTQGATRERSPREQHRLVPWEQSVGCSRAKGPSGPFCARTPGGRVGKEVRILSELWPLKFSSRCPGRLGNEGVPTQPFVGFGGGGGGTGGWRFGAWVFPLPPDGPLEIFVALPPPATGETSTVVHGSAIRAAAERARVIWT